MTRWEGMASGMTDLDGGRMNGVDQLGTHALVRPDVYVLGASSVADVNAWAAPARWRSESAASQPYRGLRPRPVSERRNLAERRTIREAER